MSDDLSVRPVAGRRVTLFVPSLAGGGAERAMLEVAHQLALREFAVDLLVTRRGGALWGSVAENVRLINLNSWKTPTCLPALVRYLKRERPAVLLSALTYANLTALLAKTLFARHLRLIVSQQNVMSAEDRTGARLFRMANRLLKSLLPAADAIVAVSRGAADDLKRAAPAAAGLVQVVPNPVVTPALIEQTRSPVDHPWTPPRRTLVQTWLLQDDAQSPTPCMVRSIPLLSHTPQKGGLNLPCPVE